MSAITSAQKGLVAVEKRQWADAVPLLSRGIDAGGANPSPAWLLARAQAYQQTGQPQLALVDTERAYRSALGRQQANTRDLLALAQYRRAVLLAHLGRYADADACCVWSQQLLQGKNFRTEPDDVALRVDADGNYLATVEEARSTEGMPTAAKKEDDKSGGGGEGGQLAGATQKVAGASEWLRAYMWRAQVLKKMEALPAGDPGRKITVPRVPEPRELTAAEKKTAAAAAAPVAKPAAAPKTEETKAPAQAAQAAPPPSAKKLRVDFYQTPDKVSLTLYAKGVDAQALRVETTGGDAARVRLSNLPAAVAGPSGAVVLVLGGAVAAAADQVRTSVTAYKVELQFAKGAPGEKWGSWGRQEEDDGGAAGGGSGPVSDISTSAAAPTATKAASAPAPAPKPAAKPAATGPAYPTSSRSGPKDWEKVADAVDSEDADAKGDADGGDVNGFFKSLYASSTPEQQRAMMKSFVESNGTALSTDWASVAAGQVATQPPEGVDVKKWEA